MLRGMLPAAIELVTDVPPADDLWVQGDATQLQQVAVNLAINARDAMPNGGRLRMCVHHQAADPSDVPSAVGTRDRGVAALVVEDTGTGMPEEVRARIFEPFFTTKSRELGTGLGMAIVHGIVTDHGGRIEVDSHEGQGTRITITLPCCDPPGADETAAPDHLVESGHGETVIVAEDNPQILTIVASALRAVGYEAVRASDGDEAVALFNAHRDRTCLVILDLDLPKKSGVACLREMRNLQPALPAIFMTGNVDPDSEEQPDGRTRLLRKPFRIGELTRRMQTRPRASASTACARATSSSFPTEQPTRNRAA